MKTIKIASNSLSVIEYLAQAKIAAGHRVVKALYVDWLCRYAVKFEAEPDPGFKRLIDQARHLDRSEAEPMTTSLP